MEKNNDDPEEETAERRDVSSDEGNAETEQFRDDEGDESNVVEVKRFQDGGKRTKSFAAIPQKLQGLCVISQNWVTDYTFFRLPFLSSLDVMNLIQEVWEWAQDQEKAYPPRTKACEALVSLSQPLQVQLLTWSSLKASIPGTGCTSFTSATRALCGCTS